MADDGKLVDYLKRVTADLKRTRQRVRELEEGAAEPIAIVSMSCRFPGGIASPDDLWEFVRSGGDAIAPFPADRGWDTGRLHGDFRLAGGFLADAAEFDAGLFGIAPREALAMDPQQRLLLETSWEALERAGLDPTGLRGTDGAVFVGMADQKYGPRRPEAADEVRGHLLTGTTSSVASGRIAYALGLQGPALTVDTACSSSLVALHLAVRALRAGECSFALVGGAAVMAEPTLFEEMAEQGGMAGDGRCKAFAAAADGTGWGEGVGVLLLKRLSAARAEGLPVLATVRGSAVNSDGRSNGLTAPNGPAQRRVIRQALTDARLSVGQVDAVEAHGTGTRLGDPIEAQALLATYGRERPEGEPLWLGSVKSNIGHTQAAAGMAGVIKMVQAMRHGTLPRTLHVDEPTPQVDWSAGDVRLLTEDRAWPETGRPRRAAVSSFGISGTNAHVVLEHEPAPAPATDRAPDPTPAAPVPWPVSAAGADALRAQARRLHRFATAAGDARPLDIAHALATTRAHLPHRAVVLGADRAELLAGLAALGAGETGPRVVRGTTAPAGPVAFLFTGQGSQRVGVGKELYATFPVFADAFDQVRERLDPLLAHPLADILDGHVADGLPLMEQTGFALPAVFALEVALFRLVEHAGVTPDFVLGHSTGELAAAHAAGVLSLDDACTLVAARGRLVQTMRTDGAMVSLEMAEDELAAVIAEAGAGDRVTIAAVNGPRAVVLSGDAEPVERVRALCAGRGHRTRRLPISHAAHSAHMEPMMDGLREVARGLTHHPARIPLVSNLTGAPVGPGTDWPEYWTRQLRETVRFQDGVRWLAAQGVTACLELGPGGALTAMARDCFDALGHDVALAAAHQHERPEPDTVLTALAELHVRGAGVDFGALLAARGGTRTELPTYAFQRERYWLPADPADPAAAPGTRPEGDADDADRLRYRVAFTPLTGLDTDARPDGPWVVVAPEGSDAEPVAAALGRATVVPAGDPGAPGETARRIAAARPSGILVLPPPDGAPVLAPALALRRALTEAGVDAPVWWATRGAVTTAGEPAPAAAQAPLWGLARALGTDGAVDLPVTADERTPRLLAAALAAAEPGDQLAVRPGGVFARRLLPALSPRRGHTWRAEGTVLVTGDIADVTPELLRLLTGDGRRIVLAHDPAVPAPDPAVLAGAGDACTLTAWDPATGTAPATPAPVTAVVHLSSIRATAPATLGTEPAAFAAETERRLRAVTLLDELYADAGLDAFLLLSTVAGTWGGTEDAAHTVAHAALEALAARRALTGRHATCVGWGPWQTTGADPAAVPGLPPMPPEGALAALRRALDADDAVAAVADVDWAEFHPVFTGRGPRPFVADLPQVRALPAPEPARPAGPAAADLRARLLDLVRAQAAAVLGHPSGDAVDPVRPFRDLGFDSLTAVRFRDRIAAETGLRLPATLVFDHPTPEAVADHVGAELGGARPADTPAPAAQTAADRDDPVVIVGMACRYPGGVHDPESLWDLVHSGREGLGDFPADRGWDLSALRRAQPDLALRAGFLPDAAEFDADFFGISPREALAMDPQQRLLLESTWEALERAGIDPSALRGSRTGVFAGAAGSDYAAALAGTPEADGYLTTGTAASVVSGRVAYTLGLHGPAVTVDTACSSSLVALHMAVGSLRTGECDLALATGVAVLSTPGAFVDFGAQSGLASDGRCKAFAATADGTNWAEGVGVLVLERMSAARRAGHRILAVVRGSAVNQDGASNGLSAPSGPAQQRVIREALADAGLSAADVDAVEAHGTGTRLGDPIEAQALLATYGRERADGRPLWLGSLKSNIGHAGAAAGVGGVIKMVQAMRHGTLPRTLHVDEPTPEVDWTTGAVELLTDNRAWPDTGRPRRAGVSSFGVSGTNAHVLLEAGPEETVTAPDAGTSPQGEGEAAAADGTGTPAPLAVPWLLSARTPDALRAQAGRLAAHTAGRELSAGAVGRALLTGRTAFEHRAVVLGAGTGELAAALRAVAGGEPGAGAVTGSVRTLGKGPVFVFPGQGGQWPGMAAELLDTSPEFAARWAECEAALAPCTDFSLTGTVRSGERIDRVDVVQPVLWAVMVSLAELWRAHGVVPAAVAGHSQGEIAAACVAGALSLEDGARVVALRARALGALSGAGGMVSVAAPRARVEEWLPRWNGEVSVAAVNGPSSVVVSGAPAALDELVAHAGAHDVRARRVDVDYASHSPQVARIEEEILTALAPVTPRPAAIPFLSTVTAQWQDTTGLDAAYWYRNLREPVLLEQAVTALAEAGHDVFVEVGPHPLLGAALAETAERAGITDPLVTGTLRRDEGGLTRMRTALAELWVRGVPVDWTPALAPGTDGATDGTAADLPTYAFQRVRYWPRPVPAGDRDPADERFWYAVDEQDLPAVAGTLGLPDEEPLRDVVPALAAWRRGRRERAAADSWRYRAEFRPLPERTGGALPGTWLLAVPAATAGAPTALAVRDALEARADRLLVAELPEDTGREVLADRLGSLLGGTVPAGVVSLTALDTSPHPGSTAVPVGLALGLTLYQALGDLGVRAPLWYLTRGAVATAEDPAGPAAPEQAAMWALGRVAALESPRDWGGLIDLPEELDERAAGRLAAVLAGADGEDQVAVRTGAAYGRRLVRAAPAAPSDEGWRPRGTVLVTGGTGALGGRVARWLAREGAEHLVLTSRRGPDAPGADALVADLTALGARVTVLPCDLADAAQAADLVERAQRDGDRIGAVVHTAGAGGLGPLAEAGLDDLAEAMAAKVSGIAHLEAALDPGQLDVVVYFSSISASWGAGDHGVYAAANGVLDARAEARCAAGVHTVSVAWAPWAGGGMADDPVFATLSRKGLPLIDPDTAITALAAALAAGDRSLLLVDVDWARFTPQFTFERATRLLDELPEARPEPPTAPGADDDTGTPFVRRLAGLTDAQRQAALRDLVREHAAAVLGHGDPAAVDPGRALKELGFDSLTAVELRNRIGTVTGLTLPATMVFDHPTADALAAYLARTLDGDGAGAPAAAAPVVRVDQDDPIAVVGMACRFPGGITSPEGLWQAVYDEADLITPFPTDRGWPLERLLDTDPDRQGASYAGHGGFLDRAGDFDPRFFGISPREAQAMDPQHRLLLESSWEALERAGIDPKGLHGSRTGVYVGLTDQAYGTRLRGAADGMEGYLVSASANVASGRVSYTLGLEGPSLTVDTACSSSLVALHLAAQALRDGECDLALAGGATVMPDPTSFVAFSRQRGLAADGRCKPFAAAADGFSLGEGAGVLIVERLSDARRRGHPVLAVVRGSAVNQDGASNGLTAPNGPAQERVIRQALVNAGLTAADVDAVEAHGTGTRLGDPIEAQALLATYGQERDPDRPLWLGSVKSNIGHTQAAAGIAGVIKTVQAMRHGLLPRSLHIDAPSPEVDWSAGAVELLTEARPWPRAGRPRRAGVSAFGISGTNAHVLLEEAPGAADPADDAPTAPREPLAHPVPLLVSARTREALRDQAARVGERIRDGADLADVAFSLATTRAVLDHTAVVVAADAAEACAALAGPDRPAAVEQPAEGSLAFLFTGQGAQRLGMGRELYAAFPAYAEALDEICDALDAHLPRPLRSVLFAEPGTAEAALLDRTLYTQTGLFAVEAALYRLLTGWGVTPDFVLGHSVGELAAAHAAGVWSTADAARVVAARARLMQDLPEGGAMLSVAVAEEEAAALLDGLDTLTVAAVNGPASVVLSGDETAVAAAAGRCAAAGLRSKRLTVSHAFHSPLVEPMLAAFAQELAGVEFAEPRLPVVSNLTGEPARPGELCDPAYWVRHVRHAVRFADGVRALLDAGVTTFLELGPDGVLTAMAQETAGDRARSIPAQRRDRDQVRTLLTALGRLHARTGGVDWHAFHEGTGARRTDLPTYAFQHRRYWLDAPAAGPAALAAAGLTGTGHPLLTATTELSASGVHLFSGTAPDTPDAPDGADAGGPADPADGPGAAARALVLDMVLWAGARLGHHRVAELAFTGAPLRPGVPLRLETAAPGPDGARSFTVHIASGDGADGRWTALATGAFDGGLTAPAPPTTADGPPPGTGPAGPGAAELTLTEEEARTAGRYALHPALLTGLAELIAELAGPPVRFTGVTRYATGATAVRARVSVTGDGAVTVLLTDPAGEPVLAVDRVDVRTGAAPARRTADETPDGLYRLAWTPLPGPAPGARPPAVWAVTGPDAETLAKTLAGQGVPTVVAHPSLDAVGEAAGARGCPDVVVIPVATEPGPRAAAVRLTTHRALALARQALADERLADARLAFVTTAAVAAGDVTEPDPAQAAARGLLLSAQAEHPDRCAVIDLDGTEPAAALLPAAVTAALTEDEPHLAVRADAVLVPRLTPAPAPTAPDTAPDTAHGTVVVTGATGGIGGEVVRHLVAAHGVRRLLLLSRKGAADPRARALRREAAEHGAEARAVACDTADRDALAAALAAVPQEHPVTAVVHIAGVVDDGVVTTLTPERVDTVLRPKADAALHLHELTRHLPLTHFVLFSSGVGTLGGAGQANYAAANAFLDALAHHRRAAGLPAVSLAWGLWETTTGMSADLSDADRRRMAAAGVLPLSPHQGLALFDAAWRAPDATLVPMRLDPSVLRRRAEAGTLPAAFRALVPAPLRRAAAARAGDGRPLAELLAEQPAHRRHQMLLDLVHQHVSAVLDYGPDVPLDAGRSFRDLGFDSLTAVELRNALVAATGVRLSAALVFDHPTADALADHLESRLLRSVAGAPLPLLTQLDHLEAALAADGLDTAVREQAAVRLKALAAAFDDRGPGGTTHADITSKLDSASDEELFDFISAEIGED
ncbi:type I polyketide synthase [Streptomyces leeuwenhoekii]